MPFPPPSPPARSTRSTPSIPQSRLLTSTTACAAEISTSSPDGKSTLVAALLNGAARAKRGGSGCEAGAKSLCPVEVQGNASWGSFDTGADRMAPRTETEPKTGVIKQVPWMINDYKVRACWLGGSWRGRKKRIYLIRLEAHQEALVLDPWFRGPRHRLDRSIGCRKRGHAKGIHKSSVAARWISFICKGLAQSCRTYAFSLRCRLPLPILTRDVDACGSFWPSCTAPGSTLCIS